MMKNLNDNKNKKTSLKKFFFELIKNYLLSKQIANGCLFVFTDKSL